MISYRFCFPFMRILHKQCACRLWRRCLSHGLRLVTSTSRPWPDCIYWPATVIYSSTSIHIQKLPKDTLNCWSGEWVLVSRRYSSPTCHFSHENSLPDSSFHEYYLSTLCIGKEKLEHSTASVGVLGISGDSTMLMTFESRRHKRPLNCRPLTQWISFRAT